MPMPMPSESVYFDNPAFIAAIRENPDDDTVRLAYADWLDEHGQRERAAFIRIQIDFAHTGTHRRPDEHTHLWSILINQLVLGTPWQLSVRGFVAHQSYTISRGFLDSGTCASADWIKLGDATLQKHPIRRVVLIGMPDLLELDVRSIGRFGFKVAEQWVWIDRKDAYAKTQVESAKHVLGLRWPGVEFEIRETASH
jgi:uncharacterized protein (TIGR02996 family)